VILWSESVKSLKQLGGRLNPTLHHDEKARQVMRSGSFLGLVGSGFSINHSGSGSMAGSDMYNLLTTVREDQASNAIRIQELFGTVGSGC
jgi:hypothetical protein